MVVPGPGEALMILFGLLLCFFAVRKKYEPLLLLPIGLGIVLVNLPISPMREEGSILGILYNVGIRNELFPLLIFVAIGAMMDFRPLIERPWLVVFGAIGQIGIFGSMLVALLLGFRLFEAASIGVIGTADGPTSIFVTSLLAPRILGPVTLAAYSYMAMVPLIQPPIMRLLTTHRERSISMSAGRAEAPDALLRLFPWIITILAGLLSPMSIPLIGMLMFGNILATSGATETLAVSAKQVLSGLVTLFLGIAVGSRMTAVVFFRTDTLLIFGLGLFAFAFSTALGVLLGKLLHAFGLKVNPLIGAAGLSSFPMSARLVQQLGREEDRGNFLLMHAASANVSGQIGSVLAGGILLDMCLRSGDSSGAAIGASMLLEGMGKVLLGLALIGLIIHVTKGILRLRQRRAGAEGGT
jgi:sodium ion-translocating decarboxylase beta subunit